MSNRLPIAQALPLLLFLTVTTASGQDCTALLAHGLRSVEVKYSSRASIATKFYRNCGYVFKDLSDNVLAAAEVEIFGQGRGNAGFSRSQRETDINQWCVTNRDAAQSAQEEYQKSQNIMASAVTAWSECNELAARQVETRPIISADQRTVSLNVSYGGPAGGGVLFYGVDAENFSCDTRIPGMSHAQVEAALSSGNSVPLGGAAVSVQCRRAVGTKKIGDQTYTWLDRATISIRTASHPYQLFFLEETIPPLPEQVAQRILADLELAKRMLPPIGSIMPFALTPIEVSKLAPHWLPADGRTVSDAQSPLDGRSLPNLTGRMLLGMDASRDASVNPPNEGGSREHGEVEIDWWTDWLDHKGHCTAWEPEGRNKFPNQNGDVWDTHQDEQVCSHQHAIKGKFAVKSELPLPPYREVIYLVRVR